MNYNCKNRYKCILTTAAIMLLGASTTYFFMQNNEQAKLIEHQKHCIEELKATINQRNTDHDRISDFDRLFSSNLFSFRNPFAGIENIFTKAWNDEDINYDLGSSYHYHSIRSTDNEYIIKVAIPGFAKDDILLELSDNILKISNKTVITPDVNLNKEEDKAQESKDKPSNIGKISLSVRIPAGIDQDSIQASLNNGLLTVILQKTDGNNSKEVKTIPIN